MRTIDEENIAVPELVKHLVIDRFHGLPNERIAQAINFRARLWINGYDPRGQTKIAYCATREPRRESRADLDVQAWMLRTEHSIESHSSEPGEHGIEPPGWAWFLRRRRHGYVSQVVAKAVRAQAVRGPTAE
jgi:hypothetical protein